MLLREPLDLGITYVTLHLQYSQVSEGLPKAISTLLCVSSAGQEFLNHHSSKQSA